MVHMGAIMRHTAAFVVCASLILAGCGTTGIFEKRTFTVRSPVGNFGDRSGTNTGADSHIKPADTVTLDLKLLIASQMGLKPETTIEEQIGKFENWTPSGVVNIEELRKQRRNEIMNSIIWASDSNCLVYLQYLRGNQLLIRSVSDSLTTIFSATSTAFAPKATKSALSALASISSGVGSNIDSSVFAKQTLDVIAGAIEADRADYRAKAISLDLAKSYAELNLTAALADAQIYHNKCDVMDGLHYLQLQTNSENTPAKTPADKPVPSAVPAAPAASPAAASASAATATTVQPPAPAPK